MTAICETKRKEDEVICKLSLDNVSKYFNDIGGNIYYRLKDDSRQTFELLDGFELEEIKAAIAYGDAEFIYMSGSAEAGIARLKALESSNNLQSVLKAIFKDKS